MVELACEELEAVSYVNTPMARVHHMNFLGTF